MSQTLVLYRVQVISLGDAGIIPSGYISIVEGTIRAVGPMSEFQPRGDEAILDLTGKTVLPGLIDSHCHLISENAYPVTEAYIVRSTIAGINAARMALSDGLTSVRDVGCRHLGIYALKSSVDEGETPGPRFQTAGRPIAGTGIMETWRSYSHDGPTEILRAVRQEWQAGANWIKLSLSDGRWRETSGWQDTPLLTLEEVRTAVEEAHRKDMRVVCHVDGPNGARLAVEGDVNSIEHGVHIPDELIDAMAEKGIVFVPTVWIYSSRDMKVFKADISFLNELHADTILRAHLAGVKIAAGVDCNYFDCPPLEGIVNELSTLVRCGLSKQEAIGAATVCGAELLGWGEYLGSIAPGKRADLVVVGGDPLVNIDNLKQLVLVMQQGQIVENKLEEGSISKPGPLLNQQPSWMNRVIDI